MCVYVCKSNYILNKRPVYIITIHHHHHHHIQVGMAWDLTQAECGSVICGDGDQRFLLDEPAIPKRN